MAKNETKSQAEIYREERKARIAKAAKQNAKNIEKSRKAANVTKKVVAIVLVIAIICGLGVWVNSLTGISQKLTKTYTITAGANTYKIDAIEFNYYYSTYYNNIYSMSSQYTQYYGYDPTGFDETLQSTTTDEDGNEVTWSKAIENYVIEAIKENYVLYNQAVVEGLTLDQDELAEIDETVTSIQASADEYGYTVNAFLSIYYGTGMTEKVFREIAQKQALAEKYSEKLQEDITNGITTDEIKEVYDESTKDYDYADYHYYIFTAETLEAEDGETEDDFNARQDAENKETFDAAQAVFDKVTDLDSFETALAEYVEEQEAEAAAEEAEDADTEETAEETADEAADEADTSDEDAEAAEDTAEEEEEEVQYSTPVVAGSYESLETATNTDLADWVYSTDREAVKKIVKDEENNKAYILYLDKAPYTSYSIDYYDCVVSDSTDEDGNEVSAETNAKTLLDSWDGEEESFATIVSENEDTTSTDQTGAVEGARITDVSGDIQTWLFSSDRKVGDTTIITDDDGAHILYFKAANKDDIDQYDTIRTNLASDKVTEKTDALTAACTFTPNQKAIDRIVNKFVKKLQLNAASSST